MILRMFTVFDSKAEAYLPPFFMQSKGQAIRSFQEVCNDPKHQFNKYPADFTLFEIGEFDDAKGVVKMDMAISLGRAIEFVVQHKMSLPDDLFGSVPGYVPPKAVTPTPAQVRQDKLDGQNE